MVKETLATGLFFVLDLDLLAYLDEVLFYSTSVFYYYSLF